MTFRRPVASLVAVLAILGLLVLWMRWSPFSVEPVSSKPEVAANAVPTGPSSTTGQPIVPAATNGGSTMASAAVSSNAPSVPDAADRFRHHAELVQARQAVWGFEEQLRAAGVPADAPDRFRAWARLLYRDSLRVGIARLPAADPAAAELLAALSADTDPRIEMVRKADLGPIPEARTTNLLVQVAALTGAPGLPETRWLVAEFAHLFSKAKQRSDSHYMSEMKKRLPSSAPVAQKLEYVRPFVEIGDVAMAEYPREYFEQLLQEPGLNPDDRVKVEELLAAIRQLGAP